MNENNEVRITVVSPFAYVRIFLLAILVAVLYVFHILPPVEWKDDKLLQIPVHRAAMFDFRGRALGSRYTFLRGDVVLATSLTEVLSSDDGASSLSPFLTDKTLFLTCDSINFQSLKSLVELPLRGVVVEYCGGEKHAILRDEALSKLLLSSAVSIPVYFISPGSEEEVKKMRELMSQVNSQSPFPPRFRIKIGDQVPKLPLEDEQMSFLVKAVLKPKKKSSAAFSSSGVHVILSAHFDTLTTAPSLPTIGNAVSVPTLLELWRRLTLFSAEDSRTAASTNSFDSLPYTVTMLLGSSSHLGYQGTEKWLRAEKSNRHSSRQSFMALCLDDLLPTESQWGALVGEPKPPLYMHIHPGFSETEEGVQFISKMQAAASATGVEVEIVPSSRRYTRGSVQWEHQVFNHFKVPGVTFSASKGDESYPLPVDPYVGNERLLSHLSQEDDARVTVSSIMLDRVNFLLHLIKSLVNEDESSKPAGEERIERYPGSERFLVGQIQKIIRSIRTTPTVQVNSSSFALMPSYAKDLVSTMKGQAANPKTAVSASINLQEWPVTSPNFLLHASPAQTMTIYKAMTLPGKLIWTGVSALLLILFTLFQYIQFPSEEKKIKSD